jgi:hypothetical protein
MRHGYDVRALVEQFHSKPAEIRMFLNGTLDASRSRELTDLMLACRSETSHRMRAGSDDLALVSIDLRPISDILRRAVAFVSANSRWKSP